MTPPCHRTAMLTLALTLAGASLSGCLATAIVGGTAATASAVGDRRSVGRHLDDVALAAKIDARLAAEKGLPSRWISVEVIDGEAILTGRLPHRAQIERAVRIARSVRGVRGVRSELSVGEPSLGNLFSDSWITARVKARLLDDPATSGLSIHVETVDGKVYLQGIVRSRAEQRRAMRLARGVDGVTAVVDLLRIRD
ncbi:MAG: BON domain-containing protein [Mariprofundaceae bacterium]